MSILVTGSMAYDYIMDFPGHFSDHILPDKVHMLSVSFMVQGLKRNRGGVAGNVAHNLRLLEAPAGILGTIGHDAGEYRAWLTERGVDTRLLATIQDEFTASCFITTDRSNNQITGFYPGAMNVCGRFSLLDAPRDLLDLVIIAPNDPVAMTRYPGECRLLDVPYIYSPAQQTVVLSPADLVDGIRGARVVLANDYEYQMIENKTGLAPESMLDLCEIVIITMGEDGSLIRTRDEEVRIPAAPARSVVDPTGAGDAYTAGIALGLLRGTPLPALGRLAALTAVYAVETYGTQNHSYTPSDFATRYRETFPDHALSAALPTAAR
ncbi:MAG: carbohydrate kinase family protein [Chloroflexi bacterium]|nr:carbohydrate kinase family protein [Chloroflexota bacterium]